MLRRLRPAEESLPDQVERQDANVRASLPVAEEVGIVDGLYLRFLGRTPDTAGRNYYINLLQTGAPLEQVQAVFIASLEFIASNNTDYIQSLYRNILGRTGASSELQYWYGALQQPGGLIDVATRFALSPENRTNFTRSLYQTFLHRDPSQAEIDTQVNGRAKLLGIEENVLSLPEYFTNG